MLEKRERYFIRHNLVLRAKRNHGASLPLVGSPTDLSAVGVLQSAAQKKTAKYDLSGGDTIRITKVVHRPADELVIVLFRRRNPNAATQVFEDADKESIRAADRGPKDDPAVSAHLFISTRGVSVGGASTYRSVMEEVQGLGSSYMKLLMDETVRKQEYDYIDSRGQTEKTYSKVDFSGVKSDNLDKAVNQNGFDFIELVKSPDLQGLDTEGLNVRPERLKIYPKRRGGSGGAAILGRVFDWGRAHGWKDISVQVRVNDKTKVVKIGRDEDAATTLFVKADLVKVANDIPSCSDQVNEDLAREALKMFAVDSGWV